MNIAYRRHGDDYSGSAPIVVREGFARVEATHEGRLIADGVSIDLRGARKPASIVAELSAVGDGLFASVVLVRDVDGDFYAEVVDTRAGENSSVSGPTDVTTFPHAIVGAVGQTVDAQHAGNITLTDGLRAAFGNAHRQLNAWGEGLDALSRYYPQSIVNAGHDWLYWAGHVAAYMVAHGSYTWLQKVVWAETVIRGAADITSPAEFYANPNAHTPPTSPKSWVDPATGAAVNLAAAVDLDGSPPTITQLSNGEWVEGLSV